MAHEREQHLLDRMRADEMRVSAKLAAQAVRIEKQRITDAYLKELRGKISEVEGAPEEPQHVMLQP